MRRMRIKNDKSWLRSNEIRSLIRGDIALMLARIASACGLRKQDLLCVTALDDFLFNQASSMEEYSNHATLQSRVEKCLIARQDVRQSELPLKNATSLGLLENQASPSRCRPQNSDDETSCVTICSDTNEHKRRPESPDEESQPPAKRVRAENLGDDNAGFLTKEQLRAHLSGLRNSTDHVTTESRISQGDEGTCKLCGLSAILFTPKHRYCSGCGLVIKHKVNHYRLKNVEEESEQRRFCVKCYNQSHGAITFFDGTRFPKKTLKLTKDVEEIEEQWVQCDSCNEWHHQICGLYNGFQETYKCPKCRLEEMESKGYKPCSSDSFITAGDLPRTLLGNHIEKRLLRRLREDREERAKLEGKSFDEVARAEDLSVRVVLSDKKSLVVNNNILTVLQDENYPTEFPYTIKMIVLFQKIEGVDVCLFTMYAQEYGSDCSHPNQRYVYISYLDSVKYFRPNINTATGEALRTFAYHEVLIGYLEYAKSRGFVSCYLWACPPQKGDQYILNCHPQSQRTPNSDRLRQWYQKMVKKAAQEGIVVNRITLYDRFFVPSGDHPECKITAARLPYLDGDYWPGVVDLLLRDIEKDMSKTTNNGGMKRPITKTSMKVLGVENRSDLVNKDALLMRKLGQNILPYKEDFMVLDLHHCCSQCHEPILSGKRWPCEPNNSYRCDRCHNLQNPDNDIELFEEAVVPMSTADKDGPLINEMCDNRYKLLQFCQESNYQFDTLRRAKHSSLMLLHNIRPIAKAKVELSKPESIAQNCNRMVQRSELVKILQHVSLCQPSAAMPCSHPDCSTVTAMFAHMTGCEVQAGGGCLKCQRTWYMLRLHTEQCTQPNCRLPFCNVLKNEASKQSKINVTELKSTSS